MKVALVAQGVQGTGGVQSIVSWLDQGLQSRGYQVDLHDLAASSRDSNSRRLVDISTWRRPLTATRAGEGSRTFRWGANWTEFESQRYRPRVQLTAALNAYDLVHVIAGAPMLACAVANVEPPKVLHFATSVTYERPTQIRQMPMVRRAVKAAALPGMHRLEVAALRAVDSVLTINRPMVDWVRGHGHVRAVFAPPGIDTELFVPSESWSPHRPVIAYGRLSDPRKDWPTAIAAYELLVERSQLANGLVLAGKGPLSPELHARLASSPQRHRIRVIVDIGAQDLPNLVASGSVFLQSSLEEGLGLAGLEAMACGLPVVTTSTVGSREYVREGRNGHLAELDSSVTEDLAQGLESVLTSGHGPEMAAMARSTCVDDYSNEAALEVIEREYAFVRGGAGRRSTDARIPTPDSDHQNVQRRRFPRGSVGE